VRFWNRLLNPFLSHASPQDSLLSERNRLVSHDVR